MNLIFSPVIRETLYLDSIVKHGRQDKRKCVRKNKDHFQRLMFRTSECPKATHYSVTTAAALSVNLWVRLYLECSIQCVIKQACKKVERIWKYRGRIFWYYSLACVIVIIFAILITGREKDLGVNSNLNCLHEHKRFFLQFFFCSIGKQNDMRAFKEINTSIQQGQIKLIKGDSKDNVTKDL